MRKLLFIVIAFFSLSIVNAQEKLTFTGIVKVEGKSKAELTTKIKTWFDGQATFKDLLNDKIDTITGKGHFPYRNPVEFEGSKTFTKEYADQTNGMFTYTIVFVVNKNGYTYTLSNFTHWPSNRTENINFGVLLTGDEVPSEIQCAVDPSWCKNVWKDMQRQINGKSPMVIGTLPFYQQ